MRLIKSTLLLSIVLLFGLQSVFAQGDKQDELAGWDVTCTMKVAKHLTNPCINLTSDGAEFSVTRDVVINSSVSGTEITLNFKRLDRTRSLEVVEITPPRDMDNEKQEFWFSGGFKGPGGGDGNTYFVTLRFTGKNPKNSMNGRGGWTDNGAHNGYIKVRDTKSGAVFTINLTANVREIEKKAKN